MSLKSDYLDASYGQSVIPMLGVDHETLIVVSLILSMAVFVAAVALTLLKSADTMQSQAQLPLDPHSRMERLP